MRRRVVSPDEPIARAVVLRRSTFPDLHPGDPLNATVRRLYPARGAKLLGGLFGYAVAIALMIRSELGLGPWDAFHVGLHRLTGMSIGVASIVTGLVIVAGTRFLGVRPGVGTLANMVLIGAFLDLLLPWIPSAPGWGWGLAYHLPGIALVGVATGLYIAAGLGMGPRDGLMIAVSERTGWAVRRVRTLIEMSALAAGWAMGGTIGVGTVLFTLTVGPSVQWGLQLFAPRPGRGAQTGGSALRTAEASDLGAARQ